MKTRIIVPCNNHGDIERDLWALLRTLESKRSDVTILKCRSALVSRARNIGVFGRRINLTWPSASMFTDDVYWFIDADTIPRYDDVIHAIDLANRDTFATGLYQIRGSQNYALGSIDMRRNKIESWSKEDVASRDRSTLGWAGGGLLIVGANVLMKIPTPYFHESVVMFADPDGTLRSDIVGEDVTFTNKIIQSGTPLEIYDFLKADHRTEKHDFQSSNDGMGAGTTIKEEL